MYLQKIYEYGIIFPGSWEKPPNKQNTDLQSISAWVKVYSRPWLGAILACNLVPWVYISFIRNA